MKHILSDNFDMSDLGEASMVLGIEVSQEGGKVSLTQWSLITETLESCGMLNCKPTNTTMEAGLVLPSQVDDYPIVNQAGYRHTAIYTFQFYEARNCFFRFSSKPGSAHWLAIKRILQYLAGNVQFSLVCQPTSVEASTRHRLTCLTDADCAFDRNDRKSTSGFAVYFNGNLISRGSKKQQVVALSTMEAEYIALANGAQETIWVQKLFQSISMSLLPAQLLYDNQSAIGFSKNQGLSSRSKRIDIKYFYVREYFRTDEYEATYCLFSEMIAEALTNSLPAPAFESFRGSLLQGLDQVELQGGFVGFGSPT